MYSTPFGIHYLFAVIAQLRLSNFVWNGNAIVAVSLRLSFHQYKFIHKVKKSFTGISLHTGLGRHVALQLSALFSEMYDNCCKHMEFFTNAREVYRKFEPQVSAQPSYKLVQVTKQCTESELLLAYIQGGFNWIYCLFTVR